MSVRPIDLQTIFMQEGRAAKEAKWARDSAKRNQKAAANRMNSKPAFVAESGAITDLDEVDDEGEPQQNTFFQKELQNNRRHRDDKKNIWDHESKGNKIDRYA